MIQKLVDRRKQKGFTLIELLIVIAIIGIIAALLVPNFLDALNKGRQKRTMGYMKNWGTAAFSWLGDRLGAGAAGATPITFAITDYEEITAEQAKTEMVPAYIQNINTLDAWRKTYFYYMNTTDPADATVLMIRSEGRDGMPDGETEVGAFDPTDYAKDTVWADGTFLRKPEKQ